MKINFREISSNLSAKINIFLVPDSLTLGSILKEFDEKNKNLIRTLITDAVFFKGKIGTSSNCMSLTEDGKIILLIGIGDINILDRKQMNTVGATITNKLNSIKIDSADVFIESDLLSSEDYENRILWLAEGIKMRNYKFNKHYVNKKKDHELYLQSINILSENSKKLTELFYNYESTINSINFARDLVSEPGNVLYPESFADRCSKLSSLGLKIRVLEEHEMKKLGMGSLLAVAQGSANTPRLVVLEWWGGDKDTPPLALVGKGVTFDTGGINLKSSSHIADMKYDMTGAAVVAGLMKTLAEQKVQQNVVGFLGLVENMPSGTAQRPSDVVTSMSGQTIEVENTDAEGRMVLADAMWYAQTEYKCNTIIDLATLTGAIGVALGDEFAGLFSNNDELAANLIDCGKAVNELLWRMPLSDHYDNRINSDIADMRNTGRVSGAGATTAAQFLQRFLTDKNNRWAHLDIAGVSWTSNGELTNGLKGATGFGVRLLEHYITNFYK